MWNLLPEVLRVKRVQGCNGQVSEIKAHSRLPNRAYSELQRGNIAHACSSFTASRSMLETDWLRRTLTQYDCSSTETHLG